MSLKNSPINTLQQLMCITMEECGELTQRCSKIMRKYESFDLIEEAQRVKLASFLSKEHSSRSIFFIFDEPTTGLHFHDILKLMDALNALVENGHTVLVVEHNLDVIKSADWIIDLGPVGGKEGGYLLYQGAPKGILKAKKSFTGQFLKGKL